MTTITRTRKHELLEELRHAYEEKGSNLTTVDADHHRYGLRYKNAYIAAFGSWNTAISRAGLPVNRWKGGRSKGTPNGHERRPRAVEQVEAASLEEAIAERLRRERAEIDMLERMMSEVQRLKRVAG